MVTAPKKQYGGRLAEKRRRVRTVRSVVIGVLVLVGIAGIAYASRLPALTISDIAISGAEAVSSDQVIATVQQTMQGSWFFLIPKKNAFFYPSGTIRKNVLDTFSRIESVSIKPRELTGLVISIAERQPHALWCSGNEVSTTSTAANCYFIDQNGFIFDEAPGFSGSAYLSYETPLEEGSPLRQYALPEDDFKKLDVFVTTLKSTLGITPQRIQVASDGEIQITLAEGGSIILERSQNFALLLENIQTVFSSELTPDKRADLDYADFRYGNKVYFKYKN